MKFIKPHSAEKCLEVEISIEELELLETALSYARRTLNVDEPEGYFGKFNPSYQDLINDIQSVLEEFDKTQPELPPKAQLQKFAAKYKKWLTDNYSEERIQEKLVDEAGYPYFKEVEDYFSQLIKNDQLKELDREDKKNLLYLIARNWDVGSLVNWFSPVKPFSSCGDIPDQDFIDLGGIVAELPNFEFEEAKFQIAASFKKFDELSPATEEILLKIHRTGEEYSSRQALLALAKLGFKDIRDLVETAWETHAENEHYRIDCLQALKFSNDDRVLKEYLDQASSDQREHISNYAAQLKSELDDR